MSRKISLVLVSLLAVGNAGYLQYDFKVGGTDCASGKLTRQDILYAGSGGCVQNGATESYRLLCEDPITYKIVTYPSTSDCTGASVTGNDINCQECLTFPPLTVVEYCTGGAYDPSTIPSSGVSVMKRYHGGFPGGSTCTAQVNSTLSDVGIVAVGVCISDAYSSMVMCNGTGTVRLAYADKTCSGASEVAEYTPDGCRPSADDPNILEVTQCYDAGEA